MLRRKGRKTIPSQLMRETVPETELDDSNNLKGKLKFAQSLNQGVSFKTDESLATPYFRNMACERNDTQVLNKKINQTIAEEELPDGSCFSRVVKLKTSAPAGPSSASLHPCEYVGSFLVAGSDQASRAEFVRIQLENLRGRPLRRLAAWRGRWPSQTTLSLAWALALSDDSQLGVGVGPLRRFSAWRGRWPSQTILSLAWALALSDDSQLGVGVGPLRRLSARRGRWPS
ncbi:uncharacterized protein LOC143251787 [Tachypleus tridentatus]|uniref:uncharacterized protein LOC143251787 n=1 Tax=Tachypleus tridentatus TaxID=6853 RepID=UPI003FCF7F66